MRIGCGCCACLAGAGHVAEVTNRPGLSAIGYRVGTYGSFYDAMIRRLSVPVDPQQPTATYSLHKLKTREGDDPSIAMLDAFAVVGDILTFYQERIANEAYLRTATERRSMIELGRLVGYTLKPGVAASAYLAYTLDDTAKTIIPAGTKAQSTPGANELPQMFETSADTEARGAWNALKPRMQRPQQITIDNVLTVKSIWIDGTTTRLNVRDPLLFEFDIGEKTAIYALRRAMRSNADAEHKRTEVVLEPIRPYYVNLAAFVREAIAEAKGKPAPGAPKKLKVLKKGAAAPAGPTVEQIEEFLQHIMCGVSRAVLIELARSMSHDIMEAAITLTDDDAPPLTPSGGPRNRAVLVAPLIKARGFAPRSQWQIGRSLTQSLAERSDFLPRLMTSFYPQLDSTLYTAIAHIATGDKLYAQFRGVHVLRRLGGVFGYNAPTVLFEDRPSDQSHQPTPGFVNEDVGTIHLDTPDDTVTVGSYAVTLNQHGAHVAKVVATETVPRTAYGISGKTTRMQLSRPWALAFLGKNDSDPYGPMISNLEIIRNTAVLAASEQLTLAQESIDRPIGMKADATVPDSESETRIELDAVVEGLAPGRRIVVSGERIDTTGTSGVAASELAMIANVEQYADAGPGGTAYSVLVLAPEGLAYQYKRASVTISANVVHATHGETRSEILGGGDAAQALQTFKLHQAPLTYTAAATQTGVATTLKVRVNDVLWHETGTLAHTLPVDRVYVTKAGDDGKVAITFGTGKQGRRLPTGADNVRVVYRSGIGKDGNVTARQIATAISRPLGVRDVVNPLAASGGADPEARDDARRSIPVSLQAMGRVVSVRDYADFARTFAGIAKASAAALSDGHTRIVHLTVGGTGDIEIDANSDLYLGLTGALAKFGDPYQPFRVELREKVVIVGAARVRVDPDYLWTSVAPAVRAALLDIFSYDRRDFGQPVYPAEVIAVIQNVPGVVNVDLDALAGIMSTDLVRVGDTTAPDPKLPPVTGVHAIVPRLARRAHHVLHPAQIAYMPPDLADLFVLTEIAHG